MVVVSVCAEDLAFVSDLLATIRERHPSARAAWMCKCLNASDASVAPLHEGACVHLPNVGREFGSFFSFLATQFYDLPDMLLFVNGGSGRNSAPALARAIAASDAPLFYVDGGVNVTGPPPSTRRNASCAGQNEAFKARAHATPGCMARAAGSACCPFDPIVMCGDCCGTFGGLCPANETNIADSQSSCEWRGRSSVNYPGAYNARLAPAQPSVYVDWLCAHWNASADDFLRVGWVPFGVFGISRAAALRWPAATYERAVAELARGGMNAGVAVHYYERAVRSIFTA